MPFLRLEGARIVPHTRPNCKIVCGIDGIVGMLR